MFKSGRNTVTIDKNCIQNTNSIDRVNLAPGRKDSQKAATYYQNSPSRKKVKEDVDDDELLEVDRTALPVIQDG